MNKLNNLKILSLTAFLAFGLITSPVYSEENSLKTAEYKVTTPLEIVAQPQVYLNQKIKINAIFNKFSTLGLDYKPAFKDSQDYISFLIKRDDISGHTIPLSEMKIIVKRDLAEKQLLDVENGDKIEFTGKVFSCALNDPWVEVESIKILTVKKKNIASNDKK